MALSFGSKGSEVEQLQAMLNVLPTGIPRLRVDGIFGTKTRSRVFEFQRANFIGVDGLVGPATLGLLEDILRRLGLLPTPPAPLPTAVRSINQEVLGMDGPNSLVKQVIPAKSLIDVATFIPGVMANQYRFTFSPLKSARLGIFAATKGGNTRAVILLLPETGVPDRTLIAITHTFGQGIKGRALLESLNWSNPLSPDLIKFTLLKHVINRWGALMLASKKQMAYVQIVRAKGPPQLGPFVNDGPFMKQVLTEMATLTGGAFSFGTVEAFTFSSGIDDLNPFLDAISPHLSLGAVYNIDPAKAKSVSKPANGTRRQFISGQTGGSPQTPGFEFLGFNRWKNEELFNTPASRDQFEYLHNHCMPQYVLHLAIEFS